MLKAISLKFNKRHLTLLFNKYIQEVSPKRTFLSQSYNCLESWNHRFETPVIQKINLDHLYHQVESRYNNSKIIEPLDIDLLVNATKEEHYLEELQDLIHKFRLCINATNMLPSTSHTLIRLLFNHEKLKEILEILNDRINYGIFPDDYCSNLLMDHFIQQKDFVGAAKVGILQMLQDDWSNQLTTEFSLYSCYHYLKSKNPEKWVSDPEPDNGEEVKVRVPFIRNPYFDDHFDLTDPKHLTGKALAWGGKVLSNPIGNTYQAIGWCFYQKWDELTTLLKSLKESTEKNIYKQAVIMINEYLSESKDNPEINIKDDIINLLKELEGNVIEDDFDQIIENVIQKAVAENEEPLVSKQKEIYKEWEATREKMINAYIENIKKEKRLKEIEEEKQDLKNREDILFFFENEDKWDLIIENKQISYPKKNINMKQEKEKEDEAYIPPEIR